MSSTTPFGSNWCLGTRWREFGIALLGALASVGLAWLAWRWDSRQRAMEFRQQVEICAQALHQDVRNLIGDIQILARFYAASDLVRGDEFALFAHLFLHRDPMLSALKWAPRVDGRERDAFETAARAEGLPAFTLHEHVQGRWQRAGARPVYFPILRIEPLTGNEAALGFDLASEPDRRAALQQACESGQPVASAPVTLVLGAANQRGLVVFAPQYAPDPAAESAAERCAHLRGFAVGVLRLGDLVETALADLPYRGIDAILRDAGLAGDAGVLHVHPSRTRAANAVLNSAALLADPRGHEIAIAVAGRQLVLRGVPAERNATGAILAVTLFWLGLVVTVGFTFLVWKRRDATRLLSASEERFRHAMEASTDGLWDWNLRTGAVYYSPRYAWMLGYDPAALVPEVGTWIDLLHPEERERIVATAQRLLREPGQYELEFRLRTRANGYRWILSRGKCVGRAADGAPERAVGTHIDITERKEIELDLRRYRRIVETSDAMLVFVDHELRYLLVNPAYAALYRTTPEALQGRRVEEVVSPEIQAQLLPGLRAVLAGASRRIALHGTDPAGRTRWIETTLRPFVEQGAVVGAVASLHDLTEIREAQTALETERARLEERVAERTVELQRLAERLQLATAAGGIGVWEWEVRTGRVIWDERTHRLYGVDPAHFETAYAAWRASLDSEDLATVDADVARALRATEPFNQEFRVRWPDGSIHWLASFGKVIRDARNEPLRMIGVNWDISARKTAETTLRATLAELERHAAHMTALNHMNELLLACDTRDEAYQVIGRGAGPLFDGCPGALAIRDDADPARLRIVAAWGQPGLLAAEFPLAHCWALRRGEVHELSATDAGAQCRHFARPPASGYLCVPLNVRGATLGLLHLGAPARQTETERQERRRLASAVGEAAKLTLANIELRERLHAQTLRDPLTGLFNRRHLDDSLPRLFARCRHQGEPLAVAMLDVDHFKRINDACGHEAGDTVLRALGALLRGWVRPGDLVCRYGGEELTLVLPGCDQATALTRMEGLRATIGSLQVSASGQDLPNITVSIGLAVSSGAEPHYALLLARADAALYEAKASGRNRVVAVSATDPPQTDAGIDPSASKPNDSV